MSRGPAARLGFIATEVQCLVRKKQLGDERKAKKSFPSVKGADWDSSNRQGF